MNLRLLAIVAGILIGLGILIGVYRYYWPESIESISRKWAESTHSDVTSESFTHWDEDDPPLIPSGRAKCHSTGIPAGRTSSSGTNSMIPFVEDGLRQLDVPQSRLHSERYRMA